MKIKVRANYKSLIAGKGVELPDFCILTGKNGSGKSHFLESLSQQNITDIFINEEKIPIEQIKYIPFNGLNPQINPNCSKENIFQIITNFWNRLAQLQRDTNRNLQMPYDKKDEIINNSWQNYGGDRKINEAYKIAANNIKNRLHKNLSLLTEDDVRQNVDVADLTPKDTFSGEFATIFKAYYLAFEANQYNIYQNSTRHTQFKTYSDDEFEKIHGPKPWVFINTILKSANLPYEVNNPENTDRDSTFHFVLRNPSKNIEIQPTDLSTGERVLMSLAMAIYNSGKKNIKNKILLIDEPDAALHPQFSRFLLETLKTYIVKEAGVKVIITTHSPTTVAMADEESIFEMNREEKIPQKISKEMALSLLCEGIPSLRVSIDKQRVVFVESSYDAENYHKIFDLVKRIHPFEIQPIFHAANPHNGSNCDDVRDIVSKLSNVSGIYGIIDHDNHSTSTEKIIVMGEGGELRYTIENYILDPIYIGLAILHDNLASIPFSEISYRDFDKTDKNIKQDYLNWIYSELELTNDSVTYTTLGNETYSISKDWITQQGHLLETKIKNKWPAFNRICDRNKGDNGLKSKLLDSVIKEFPEYLSVDFVKLFNSLL